jgi:hypothetical protein
LITVITHIGELLLLCVTLQPLKKAHYYFG